MHLKSRLFSGLGILLCLVSCSYTQDKNMDDLTRMRYDMVYSQIEMRGIRDAGVINAMRKVERHLFVPESYRQVSYGDYPLPIGSGQTISQPYIVALMTDVLELEATDKVLEIGTGSGYQAAILAEICDSVFSIEIYKDLYSKSSELLNSLGYGNIILRHGDGYQGWDEYAPFDAIIVTCAPSHIPPALEAQLAEGGRMVIPTGGDDRQELVLLKKRNGRLARQEIIPVIFVPMIREDGNRY